jgi:hypothetical protein
MKKTAAIIFLIALFALVFGLYASAQKPDSIITKHHIYTKDTLLSIPSYTVTFTMVKQVDTIIIYKFTGSTGPVGTTTTPATGLIRQMYVGSWYSKITNTAKLNTLIGYCKQLKINGIAPYGADGMLGNATNENILNTAINTFHANGIKVLAVGSDAAGYNGFKKYMETHTGRFDGQLRENEVWNLPVASQPQGIIDDSLMAIINKGISQTFEGNYCPYVGWQCQGKRFFNMVASTSTILYIHVYSASPLSLGYAQGRLNDFNDYLKAHGIRLMVVIISSAEPAFSQLWFKTHTLDEVDAYWQPIINGFSNLKYGGQIVFLDDFLMVSIPYKSPLLSFRKMFTNYSGSIFKNETTEKSLRNAVDPNK